MYVHFDADSFFASVLQRKYPQYKNKPLIALGMGGKSVIAATYDVKKLGIKTGTPLFEAKKICPQAICIHTDFAETAVASKQIEGIIQTFSPFTEAMSIDEWGMDMRAMVGGVPQNILAWAHSAQTHIKKYTDIPVSLGIAPSRILAKMASKINKPYGIAVVQNESHEHNVLSVEQFLHKQRIEDIPGIGKHRQVHAHARGWYTAHDFAQADALQVQSVFGKPGLELQSEIQGISVYVIKTEKEPPKSISRARSFSPTNSRDFILAHMWHHVSYLVLKMRRHKFMCTWVQVSLRNKQYKYLSIDCKLPKPMDSEASIAPYAEYAISKLWPSIQICTQVSITIGGFKPKAAVQFSLFDDVTKVIKQEDLQNTLDTIHINFGRDAIMHGSALPIKSGVKRGSGVW